MPATQLSTPRPRLTLQEAAAQGPFGYSTLRKKIASGELPAVQVGRRFLVDPADVESLTSPVVGRPTEKASLSAAIDRIVAAAPRLSPDQRRQLAAVLGGDDL